MVMIDITNFTGRTGNQMFQYAYLYSQVRDGKIPDLWLQSEEYFAKYKEEIKELFGSDIGLLPYVAVHVRRGDYVNNPFYVDLFEDRYYERAMAQFPDAQFMVFSDDIEWCKKQDVFKGCLFSNQVGDVEALNEMASCVGHVIANSSFSWWGAYLSPHGGKVVAPKSWHPDKVKRTQLPASWIQL